MRAPGGGSPLLLPGRPSTDGQVKPSLVTSYEGAIKTAVLVSLSGAACARFNRAVLMLNSALVVRGSFNR
jgi:hypothetical protein